MENSITGSLIVILVLIAAPFLLPILLGFKENNYSSLPAKAPVYRTPIIEFWHKIYFWPWGEDIFNMVLSFMFPFAGFNCKVFDIEPGKVKARVINRWSVRDNTGNTDLTSLVGPAKIVALLTLSSLMPDSKIASHGFQLVDAKTVKGPLYLTCTSSIPRGPTTTSVVITDNKANLVGVMKFFWTVERRSPSIVRFK